MYCNKCGYRFEGNFCPKCGAVSKTAVTQEKETTTGFNQIQDEDNPYNAYYSQPASYGQSTQSQVNSTYYEPHPDYQPPRPEPQPQPQAVATPPQNQYQQPNYATPPYYPPHPPKKEMSTGNIVLIVLLSVLGFFLLQTALPIGCLGCMIAYEDAYLNDYTEDYQIDNQTLSAVETAYGDCFSYFISDFSKTEKYNGKKAPEGYEYLNVSIDITNTSEQNQEIYFVASCYNSATYCKKIYSEEMDFEYEILHKGKEVTVNYVFEVPVDSNNLSITITDDYYDGETFTFLLD